MSIGFHYTMNSRFLITGVFILFSINNSLSDLNFQCAPNEVKLNKILTSLQDALIFLGKEYNELNLDVISGLRMTQAEFKAAFIFTPHSAPGPSIRRRLSEMSDFVDGLVELAEPYVYKTLPIYYKNFSELFRKGFWRVSGRKTSHLPNFPFIFGKVNTVKITEAASDDCLTELLGTGPSRKRCTVTNLCLQIMESDGYTGYEKTHQLLYFMLIDRLQCFNYDKLRVKRNEHVIEGLCSAIYKQAIGVAKGGFSGRIDHDLFMEQIAFCGGLLGYDQFLRSDWLNHILSWQLESGCFSVVNQDISDNSPTVSRRKRMDVKLEDGGYGCFGHCTAVAVISLGGYLRAEVENLKQCLEVS